MPCPELGVYKIRSSLLVGCGMFVGLVVSAVRTQLSSKLPELQVAYRAPLNDFFQRALETLR